MGAALATILLALACALWPLTGAAVEVGQFPVLGRLIDDMTHEYGFTRQELADVFARAQLRPAIIQIMNRPNEDLPWYQYRRFFVTRDAARRGLRFWRANADALKRARALYGVPPELIVAILGVETQYGRNTGDIPVLDALTTLAVDYPRRSDFFLRQLEQFLLLCRETGTDPVTVKGSYAGAMGMAQFIPSSYRRYAVDFDGDGRRGLLTSTADAIGSVANFFAAHGWRRGQPVVDDAQAEGSLYNWILDHGAQPVLSLERLLSYGVAPPARSQPAPMASLLTLEGRRGPLYFLAYNNFYVITSYNRSTNYAMAVYELGQSIRRLRDERGRR